LSQQHLQQMTAQILRHKLNTQGWQLPPEQLLQLRDLLLRRLRATQAGGALLSELLLCLAAVFILLPDWRDLVGATRAALEPARLARFLQLLAEEAGGDLRRVHHGGIGEPPCMCVSRARAAQWRAEVATMS
jgi:CRP-like cAMP-binding protein